MPDPTPPTDADPVATLLADARDALERSVLVKVVVAAPDRDAPGNDPTLRSVAVRPVTIKAGPRLQLVFHHERRDVTRNLAYDEAFTAIAALVPAAFRHLHLVTTERTVQLEQRGGAWKRSEGPAAHTAPASHEHDRVKRRVFAVDDRWFDALDAAGGSARSTRGRRAAQDKVRQVHRFVEVLDHLLRDVVPDPGVDGGRMRWVDIGAGSGALTYATWAYLRHRGWAAEVTGVELRLELAAKTERIARELGCDGLTFVAGAADDALARASEAGRVDGVIALHACDTATDDALAAGVLAEARWMLVAPCCHREVRPQLTVVAPLDAALRHGILRTREAEIATDALRAALLTAAGYDAKVFEFVSSEHTDKNLMISAVRGASAPASAGFAVRALAAYYGVRHQRLADRLGLSLGATAE